MSSQSFVAYWFSRGWRRKSFAFVFGLLISTLCIFNSGSIAAMTSIIFLFEQSHKSTGISDFRIQYDCIFPKISARTFFIASFMEGAIYFFTFILHSPPQHFELQHWLLIHYMKELEHVGNTFLSIV